MWECKGLMWDGRRKTRGSIKDGIVGAQPRCLILFPEEDHRGVMAGVPIPAGDRQKKLILCEHA